MDTPEPSPVIALAGRRIDAADATEERFPLASAPRVRESIHRLLSERHASALVASAACGADLLALDAADELGIRCRVVLPSARERFRETSVTDRPGDWDETFDRLVERAEQAGDLVVLEPAEEGEPAYAAANEAILDEALRLAGAERQPGSAAPGVLAVVVWEGKARGEGDLTEHFATAARARGIPVVEILTRQGQ